MGFFRRLFGIEERSNSVPISDLKWQGQYALYGYDRNTQGYGPRTESSPVDFETYASRLYKSSAVVFAVSQVRMRTFSQISFKWRPLDAVSIPHSLFGTRELSILENPWPGAKTSDLLARAEQDVTIAGNFYLVRELGEDGQPRLRRLRPDWVDIVLTEDPDRAVRSDVVGYRYYPGGYGGPGEPVDYVAEEVCHWAPIPDPVAQYRGMSWLTPALNDILVDKGANRHKVNFFKRGAVLSTIFMMDKGVTKEQTREWRDEMTASHGGADNAFRPLFLGGGSDVKVIETDFSKMDLKSLSGTAETHIAAAAGVHPTVVGLSEGLSGSSLNAGNYKVANRGFVNGTMHPLWHSLADALENVVIKPRGRRGRNQPVRLWYTAADVAALNDDRLEKAEIMSQDAKTVNNLVREGWEWESAKEYVITGNFDALKHSGRVSVQLYDPSKDVGSVAENIDDNVEFKEKPQKESNNA